MPRSSALLTSTNFVAVWAGEELRSMNGQIEFLLRQALVDAKRLGKK